MTWGHRPVRQVGRFVAVAVIGLTGTLGGTLAGTLDGLTATAVVAAAPAQLPATPTTDPATAPTEPQPEPTQPAPTPTAAPSPEPTVAPIDDGGDDGIDWQPIAIAVVLGVVLIAVIAALVGRGNRTRRTSTHRTAAWATVAAGPPSVQVQLLTTAQWIHDQLTLELLAAAPTAATARWYAERPRLDDVVIGAQQQWAAGHGDNWQRLAQTLSALAAAIDTNLRTRSQTPVDARLVEESAAVVHRQRAVLQQLVTVMWPLAQR